MKNNNFNELKNEYQEAIYEISKRGPDVTDYYLLSNFFLAVQYLRSKNLITNDEFLNTRDWFNGAMTSTKTLQGHVCLKPYGYDGDFDIIDKIYQKHTATDERYKKWDVFFHKGDSAQAVRNRKDYFLSVLNKLKPNSKILNLASGPCRDILEYSNKNEKHLEFHNIDIDDNAITYAKKLLENVNSVSCKFEKINIFKFIPDQKYDLIWSAGLFDYFDDNTFQRLLDRFAGFVKPNGNIIIGNFNTNSNSRAYMEYGNWFLNYRDEEKLLSLSSKLKHLTPTINFEPMKVNLFLNLN